jgi:hypothetical protein
MTPTSSVRPGSESGVATLLPDQRLIRLVRQKRVQGKRCDTRRTGGFWFGLPPTV